MKRKIIAPPLRGHFAGIEGRALIANNQKGIRQDNIYVPNEIVNAERKFGIPVRQGYEKAIISNGRLVHMASSVYRHLPNDKFFGELERTLQKENIGVIKRYINRNDRSFSADYILNDDKYHIDVKTGNDKLRPMMTLASSYDGTVLGQGHFGFHRGVCDNGLHITVSKLKFAVKHRGDDLMEVVITNIQDLISEFMSNEYYTLKEKFEVMAEKIIVDVNEFVEMTCDEIGVFSFTKSEENEEASKKAVMVIDKIAAECKLLNQKPNCWIAYNAFNYVLHKKLTRSFTNMYSMDKKLFQHAFDYAVSN